MPIVTVEQSPRDIERKRRLVAGITQAFVDAYEVSPRARSGVHPRSRAPELGEGRQARGGPVTPHYPCFYCVPGARESWASLPIVFEHAYEGDPEMDWTHAAVVIRHDPSPTHPAWSRSSEGPGMAETSSLTRRQIPRRI